MITIKRKQFTLYDQTDNLKRMKDSDILAEKNKQASYLSGTSNVASGAAGGAAKGALIGVGVAGAGALAGSIRRARAARAAKAGVAGAAGKAGKSLLRTKWGAGAAIGGLYFGAKAYQNENQKIQDINAYNRRLRYAQAQARRRELKDWKKNMTQRDGYSY